MPINHMLINHMLINHMLINHIPIHQIPINDRQTYMNKRWTFAICPRLTRRRYGADRRATRAGFVCLALSLLTSGWLGLAQAAGPVYIGFDGAYSQKDSTSAIAIELGTQLAISEINRAGGVLNGRPLVLLTKDNDGLTARAEDNFREFAEQKDLVAVYGGKFSPTTMQNMPLSNELGLILVSVWGSAEPITAMPAAYPFVYRLSLRDQWAIPAMMRHAKQVYWAKRLCSIMPKTAWGRSGETALENNLERLDQSLVHVRWYNWGEGDFSRVIDRCIEEGAQAAILIANEQGGAAWINDMSAQPADRRLPTVAHWGVTGGAIHKLVGQNIIGLDVDIIQTFTFIRNERPVAKALAREVLDDQRFTTVDNISSPVGVAQAYDMTHLLALAIDQAGSTDRALIRQAMQDVEFYDGAIRTYERPFSEKNHDALTAQQVLFVRLQPDGALYPIETE
jgi:branched-chain amino acid transport system substrate-binding protein